MDGTDDDEPTFTDTLGLAALRVVKKLSVTPDREAQGDERCSNDGKQHTGKSDCDNRLLHRLRDWDTLDCLPHGV